MSALVILLLFFELFGVKAGRSGARWLAGRARALGADRADPQAQEPPRQRPRQQGRRLVRCGTVKSPLDSKPSSNFALQTIAMIHCGWNRQAQFTPDRSTQAFLSQVLDITKRHTQLFSCDDPIDAIHLLDDFHSAGRISGNKRIPLADLTVGQSFTIDGQRLEVNDSLTRYQYELNPNPRFKALLGQLHDRTGFRSSSYR